MTWVIIFILVVFDVKAKLMKNMSPFSKLFYFLESRHRNRFFIYLFENPM